MTDREIMQQALDALKYNQSNWEGKPEALAALEAALAQPDNQESVSHLWECIGRWSAYLAANGKQGNLAPPEWLVDAVKSATAPPKREWVGLTDKEIKKIMQRWRNGYIDIKDVEQLLKELNT